MNDYSAEVIRSLEPSFQRLIAMHPVKPGLMPPTTPKAGIYLLSEGNHHLYVGRTRDIKGRISRHCKPGATHRMAAFAFRLGREATGNLTATYKQEGSRSGLMGDPAFRKAFDEAKKRIREMDLRFVQEDDPVR